ncbi:hypothetical protein EV122DRAFT_210432 [Schizophyllum commune]
MGAQSSVKRSSPLTHVPLEEGLLFTDACDFHVQHNPDHTCFAYAEADGTVREITYLEFGRAVHRAAHALRPGREGEDGLVVAFIALSDTLLYHAITVGLMKAGFIPFPISPRLSPPAVANLLRVSQCHRLVTTQHTLRPLIDALRQELGAGYDLTVSEVPALNVVFPNLAEEDASHAFEAYPEPTVQPSPEDILIYLHSSGSTGFPKAVGHTRASMAGWTRLAVVTDMRRFHPRPRFATHILPPFHTMGLCAQLVTAIFGGPEVALFPPVVKTPTDVPPPPTPDGQLAAARASGCDAMVMVPAYVQLWAADPDAVEYMKSLQLLGFAGGPLSDATGDFLAEAGVKLRSIYGATEFGVTSHVKPTRDEDWKEWRWIELDANARLAWDKQSDGTEELLVLAGGNHWHMPVVYNMQKRPGYATNDLFVAHPTKPHLRRVVGRRDDVIVHSTGEKTVPAPIEGVVLTSPLVAAAVMFGRGRDEAGILIEPAPAHQVDVDDDTAVATYRNAVWPVIEEANRVAPAYSRIFKELILITRKGKPLPRTEKNTVMRKLALEVYSADIEKIYAVVESHAQTGEKGVKPPNSWDVAAVAAWLAEHVRDITGRDMDIAADLFEQGFDSLNATVLRLRLLGALKSDPSASSAALSIAQNVVYDYPSIEKLAALVSKLVGGEEHHAEAPEARANEAIVAMAAKYSEGLPGYAGAAALPKYVAATDPKPLSMPVSVLVTGTTGNLGAELLAILLKDERVERVYTLDREASVPVWDRQRARFADKGLDVELLKSEKLVTLAGDAYADRLGQSEALYDEARLSSFACTPLTDMLSRVNVIIHAAWRLDFNLGLSAFERSIQGTRELVDLARKTQHADSVRFLFTSSIASTRSWDASQGPVAEKLIDDAGVSVLGGGYGQSKYVAERLLAASGISFSSIRVGQVSGGKPRGAWATTDWFPILVKTSIALGALPDSGQTVSWVPMDAVAGTLVDAALSESALSPSHNLVHPRPVPWSQVIANVQRSIDVTLHRQVPIVPFSQWLKQLNAVAHKSDVDVQNIPGVKLLEFFKGLNSAYALGSFATDKMQAASKTLRNASWLDQADADAWVRYWHESGLLA